MQWKQGAALIALCGLILGGVGGVWAQTPVPQSSSVVNDVAQATQALGILTVVVLVVVFVLASIVVFFVIVAFRLGLPLVSALTKAYDILSQRIKAEDEKERSNTQLQIQHTDSVTQLSESVGKVVQIAADAETRKESKERGQSEVEQVNTHTDEAMKPVAQNLETMIKSLGELRDDVRRLATRDEVKMMVDARVTGMIDTLRAAQEDSSPRLSVPELNPLSPAAPLNEAP